MKYWSKVHIKDTNKDIEVIAKSLTNYLFQYGPIQNISQKYNMDSNDKTMITQYTANRIAGLLLLYFTKDVKRINDIANKYNLANTNIVDIIPEIEAYIEK